MKLTTPRYFILFGVISLLMCGGLYLASSRRSGSDHPNSPAGAIAPLDDTGKYVGAEKHSESIPPSSPGPVKKHPNVFGLDGDVTLQDIPAGRFRDEMVGLSVPARQAALEKLGKLKVPLNDVASLHVDANGQLFYSCDPPRRPPVPRLTAAVERATLSATLPGSTEKNTAAAMVPITTPPLRHSRPGATKIIYLDFNGQRISGTAWNEGQGTLGNVDYREAVDPYLAKPFDTDGDPANFGDTEQSAIVKIWERVAEDYRPFDVDVTTEEPATFNNNTGRILITDHVDANKRDMPAASSAGVAYLDVFGKDGYAGYLSPALVYADQNYGREEFIAEVASHEMGHNLSLSHDGTIGGNAYYGGHGQGETSWNTIMGGAFNENVTQWSKGEYYNANNHQDDLAILAGHLSYIPVDHPDNNAGATPLNVSGLTVSGAGIVTQTGEADRFSFASGAGTITINVSPFRSASDSNGGNLDVALELYNSGGTLVAGANADSVTASTLSTTVTGGIYYLRVLGAASGAPLSSQPTGYTNYGSLGQYTISGTVVSTAPIAPSITSQPVNQSVNAGQTAQFTLGVSGYPAPTFQWQRLPAGSGTWTNLSNGGAYSGTTTATLTVTGATSAMNGDQFRCTATNTSGTATSASRTLTVVSLIIAPGNAVITITVE